MYVMYDKAIFLTEDEYKFNVKVDNIQAIIEEPSLYIISRCPATDSQLACNTLRRSSTPG